MPINYSPRVRGTVSVNASGTISFQTTSITIEEQNTASLVVQRTNGSTGEVSVDVDIVGLGAAGYTNNTVTLTWLDGVDGTQTINIPLLTDISTQVDGSASLSNPQIISGGVTPPDLADTFAPITVTVDTGGGTPPPASMPLLENFVISRTTTAPGFVDFEADSANNRYTHGRSLYPGIEWRYRVVCKGLSLPYYLEIDDAPAGMTLNPFLELVNGEWVWHGDAYVLEWQNPVAGTYNLQLTATGQNLTSIQTPLRTIHVETARHYFIGGAGASNANDGLTPSTPWADDFPIHGGLDATSNVLEGVVHLQGNGNIDLQGETSGGNYVMSTEGRPKQFVGIPGDSPVMRLTNGRLTVNSVEDAYFQDFQMEMLNPVSTFQNRGFIHVLQGDGRVRLDGITFTGFVDGTTTGQENGSCFTTYSRTFNYRTGVAMVNCTQTGDACSFWNTYSLQGAVFMGNRQFNATYVNTDTASTAQQMRWKQYTTECLAAYNELWEGNTWTNSGGIGYNSNCNNSEWAYNRIRVQNVTGTGTNQAAQRMASNNNDSTCNNHVYRNSLSGDGTRASVDYTSPPETGPTDQNERDFIELNILDGTNNETIHATLAVKSNNIESASPGNLLDATMSPTGAADVATHGARIQDIRR